MATKRIRGTFHELGDYQCPLDGSITIDDDTRIVQSINVGGMGFEDFEDCCSFTFKSTSEELFDESDAYFNN